MWNRPEVDRNRSGSRRGPVYPLMVLLAASCGTAPEPAQEPASTTTQTEEKHILAPKPAATPTPAASLSPGWDVRVRAVGDATLDGEGSTAALTGLVVDVTRRGRAGTARLDASSVLGVTSDGTYLSPAALGLLGVSAGVNGEVVGEIFRGRLTIGNTSFTVPNPGNAPEFNGEISLRLAKGSFGVDGSGRTAVNTGSIVSVLYDSRPVSAAAAAVLESERVLVVKRPSAGAFFGTFDVPPERTVRVSLLFSSERARLPSIVVLDRLLEVPDTAAVDSAEGSLPAAILAGRAADVARLLADERAGADPAPGDAGHDLLTPLVAAATVGNAKLAETILQHGASPTWKGQDGWTALTTAARYGHAEVASLLLARGADANAKGVFDFGPLHLAAEDGALDAVEALLRGGARVDQQTVTTWTPLLLAAKNGHRDVVASLLDHGADIHAEQREVGTSLALAARAGDDALIMLLLDHGAPVDHGVGKTGRQFTERPDSALVAAAQNGRVSAINLLLDHGASIDAARPGGMFPLLAAARAGYVDAVRALLARGANIDLKLAGGGETALMVAASWGKADVVNALLDAGAAPMLKSANGRTAKTYAERAAHPEIVAVLEAREPKVTEAAHPRPGVASKKR